jgi:hypothetical protein
MHWVPMINGYKTWHKETEIGYVELWNNWVPLVMTTAIIVYASENEVGCAFKCEALNSSGW